MSILAIENYIENGYDNIEGWISPHILRILGHFSEEMNAAGVVGGSCEIGVFQGRFIIGLSHAVEFRHSLAIDIFDNQEANIDNSGGGYSNLLETFRKNVNSYGRNSISDLTIDSFNLNAENAQDIRKRFGLFQFFSIDGGHDPEHVINDYRFAETVTHAGGAIIIDDFLNAGWPGVIEGVASLFLLDRPKFIPFAIGHNKLILVGKSYHRRYLESMRRRLESAMPGHVFWTKKLFGSEIICIL